MSFYLIISKVADYTDRIYSTESEMTENTDTASHDSYLGWHLEIDSEGQIRTIFYDKRDIRIVGEYISSNGYT